MKQFLFIRRASEVYTIPVSSFSHAEYTSDTTITLYFEGSKTGKNSTVAVVLTVTSGKATDVINSISSQVANSSATVFKYDDINDTFFTKNVTGITSITTFMEDVVTPIYPAITITDESSDTTCFPLFVTAATGDLSPKTGSNFAFNSSTGELTVDGVITAKTMHSLRCTFFDDMGTTKHYLPIGAPPNEQTSDGNSYTDFLCPCNIVVKSVIVKLPSVTSGSGNLTVSVEKTEINTTPGSTPTSVESETLAIADSDDNHVAYFNFDNAAVEVGANLQIGIQSDSDLSGSANWYTQVIMEMDWSTRYTGSSSVKDS